MLRLLICLGLFGGVLIAGTAQATMVDFTDNSWVGFHGDTRASRTFDGNKFTLSTGGSDRLRFKERYDGRGANLAGVRDGVGINNDEISSAGGERLTATFSRAVTLNSAHFLDLYASEGEYAQMLVNFAGGDSQTLTFSAMAGSPGGYLLSPEFALANVLSIEFFADDKSGISDFALAGLEFKWPEDIASKNPEQSNQFMSAALASRVLQQTEQSVPAPGVPWLMLIGLLLMGLTGTRARRRPGSLPILPIRP